MPLDVRWRDIIKLPSIQFRRVNSRSAGERYHNPARFIDYLRFSQSIALLRQQTESSRWIIADYKTYAQLFHSETVPLYLRAGAIPQDFVTQADWTGCFSRASAFTQTIINLLQLN